MSRDKLADMLESYLNSVGVVFLILILIIIGGYLYDKFTSNNPFRSPEGTVKKFLYYYYKQDPKMLDFSCKKVELFTVMKRKEMLDVDEESKRKLGISIFERYDVDMSNVTIDTIEEGNNYKVMKPRGYVRRTDKIYLGNPEEIQINDDEKYTVVKERFSWKICPPDEQSTEVKQEKVNQEKIKHERELNSKEWEYFDTGNNNILYYSKTDITKSSNIISVFVKTIVSDENRKKISEKSVKYQNLHHSISLVKIDCNNKLYTIKGNVYYDDKGKGIEWFNKENDGWESIISGNTFDTLYKKVCVTQ